MEKHTRKLKGYYPFAKKYPSKRGEGYAIGESRKMKKKEALGKALLAAVLVVVFALVFTATALYWQLANRPLPEENEAPAGITVDEAGKIRAVLITEYEGSAFDSALQAAREQGFNAVMLDYKTREGYITFPSSEQNAPQEVKKIGTAALEKIKAQGFTLVARIYCFEDRTAPQRLNAYTYLDPERTKIWFDAPAAQGGGSWINPTSEAGRKYLCSVISDAVKAGADCIYLDSVQFPPAREGNTPYFTEDDSQLNRNAVLSQFLEEAVKSAGTAPVILALPENGVKGGDAERFGGTLFDSAAAICSPVIPSAENYAQAVSEKNAEYTELAKNNFSTLKVVPTLQIQPENPDFYSQLEKIGVTSYIIVP